MLHIYIDIYAMLHRHTLQFTGIHTHTEAHMHVFAVSMTVPTFTVFIGIVICSTFQNVL